MNDYADKLLALMKFRRKTVEDCEKAIETAGLDKYETGKILEELGKGEEFAPHLLTYNMAFKESFDEVSEYYKKFTDVLIEVKKEVHKRELAKVEDENREKLNKQKKQNEDLDKLNEQIKNNKDRLKKLSDDMKNNNNQPESPSPKEEPNPNLPKKEDTFDEQCKREYIEETERQLKKNSISDQELNDALGVND